MIRDDAVKVYPEIARSDTLLYVSRIKYGGYDTVMKTMLEDYGNPSSMHQKGVDAEKYMRDTRSVIAST